MWLKDNSMAWPQLLHSNPFLHLPCLAFFLVACFIPSCLANCKFPSCTSLQCTVWKTFQLVSIRLWNMYVKKTQKTQRELIHLICYLILNRQDFPPILSPQLMCNFSTRNTISPEKCTIFACNMKFCHSTKIVLHKYNVWSYYNQFYHVACSDICHSLSFGFGLTTAGGCESWQTGNIRGSDHVGPFVYCLSIFYL